MRYVSGHDFKRHGRVRRARRNDMPILLMHSYTEVQLASAGSGPRSHARPFGFSSTLTNLPDLWVKPIVVSYSQRAATAG